MRPTWAKPAILALGLLSVVVFCGLRTPAADAVSCFGGPADSAINQYCESVPTSSGRPSSGGGGSSSSGQGSASAMKGGASSLQGGTLATELPTPLLAQINTAPAAGTGGEPRARHPSSAAPASRRSRASERMAVARRRLLSLPAAVIQPASLPLRPVSANVWTPFMWLAGTLLALALVLAAGAFAINRSRRA